MHINKICIRGYKRFASSNIKSLEAEFPDPVTIIIGSNGSGKSSLLNELCPLPAVRTDYEKDGYKSLDISHDGHNYLLISDFSNKNSPHSFLLDNHELNIGHTTDVQTELVEKHFGITGSIRDLIYNKVRLTNTTRSERKNLFIKINPMDLELIVDVHKKTLSLIKDSKAQLALLQTSKLNLETKMMSKEILEQHKATKKSLQQQNDLLQQIIYALWQHCDNILTRFKDDVEYIKRSKGLPIEDIMNFCKQLYRDAEKFSSISRTTLQEDKNKLSHVQQELETKISLISESIASLGKEIDEYQRHLDNTSSKPISNIEKELISIDTELNKYDNIKLFNIPYDLLEEHEQAVSDIEQLIKKIVYANVEVISPNVMREKIYTYKNLEFNLRSIAEQISHLEGRVVSLSEEKTKFQNKASIPIECNFNCGLKRIVKARSSKIDEELALTTKNLNIAKDTRDSYLKKKDELSSLVTPYIDNDLINVYERIKGILLNSYFDYFTTDEALIDKLNTQPLKIVEELKDIISGSVAAHDKQLLEHKKLRLSTELKTLMKSDAASLDFLKAEMTKKETEMNSKLSLLRKYESDKKEVDTQYNLYLEYIAACDKIEEFSDKYSREERGLMVKHAYRYWHTLRERYLDVKRKIEEELRSVENIVKEQDNLVYTYEKEILPMIAKISKEKEIYEKIELAVSPNNGIPHRSMVKYLNTLIHNVNYFISQVWTYDMKIKEISSTDPLDYNFGITVKGIPGKDISCTSDGQAEIIDLVWVLVILLQMKLLNKIPFFIDEVGRCMDEMHRQRVLALFTSLISGGLVDQIFMINHYAAMSEGFKSCNVVCLNNDNLTETPNNTNQHVHITYY